MITEPLPEHLQKAAYEISLLMKINGYSEWRYGPIADRNLVDRLEKEIAELKEKIVELRAYLQQGN